MDELDDLEDARAALQPSSSVGVPRNGGYLAPITIRSGAPVPPTSVTFTVPDPTLVRRYPPSLERFVQPARRTRARTH